MPTANGDGQWLRWVVGILATIIILMAAGWANEVRNTQNATNHELRSIDARLTRIEASMGIKSQSRSGEE